MTKTVQRRHFGAKVNSVNPSRPTKPEGSMKNSDQRWRYDRTTLLDLKEDLDRLDASKSGVSEARAIVEFAIKHQSHLPRRMACTKAAEMCRNSLGERNITRGMALIRSIIG